MDNYRIDRDTAIRILRDLIRCVERGTLVPNETLKSVCGQEYCDAIRTAAPVAYTLALDSLIED